MYERSGIWTRLRHFLANSQLSGKGVKCYVFLSKFDRKLSQFRVFLCIKYQFSKFKKWHLVRKNKCQEAENMRKSVVVLSLIWSTGVDFSKMRNAAVVYFSAHYCLRKILNHFSLVPDIIISDTWVICNHQESDHYYFPLEKHKPSLRH